MSSPNIQSIIQETLSIEKTNNTKKNKKNDISDEEKNKLWNLFQENIPKKIKNH